MIYDPICRQRVTMLGKYPLQDHSFRFGKKIKSEFPFRFVQVRYEEPREGGFKVGEVRDVDINSLVADDGSRELHTAYESLPIVETAKAE